MSSVLIVESKNDKVFAQALVEHLNLQNIELDEPICQIDDYECLNGLSQASLTAALDSLKGGLLTDDIQAIGIILDDDGKRAERIELINNAVQEVFDSVDQFSDTGKLIAVSTTIDGDTISVQLACFLTSIDGKGELETVLRAIKNKPSLYADCLDEWKRCLEANGKTISDRNFDKFWLNTYIRFDTCSNREQRQADRKCSMRNFEYVMEHKRDIWDFNHPILNEFKRFLKLFDVLTPH